jgi:hypothetical protein
VIKRTVPRNSTAIQAPRYSVIQKGKMFHVFDRIKRRIVMRTATLAEATQIMEDKEKAEPKPAPTAKAR